jgi:hypothetical protein
MTLDHPIRRVLARICSAEAMASLVDPILADIHWERGRPAWRGYRDLTAALLIHGVTSVPDVISNIWSDDRRAMPKAAMLCLLIAVASSIPLTLAPLSQYEARMWPAFLLLTPQALVLTLPAALLAALPVALKGVNVHARVIRRTLALAVCLVGLTFGLAWIFPNTNQAFRVLVAGQPVTRGANELGFTHLRGRIREASEVRGGNDAAVRTLEYSYQNRLALICAPIPIAFLALGLAASRAGRRYPTATGISSTFMYLSLMPATSLAAWLLLRGSHVPPILIAWIPTR